MGFWHADNDSEILARRVESAAKRHKGEGQAQDDVEKKIDEKMDLLSKTQPDHEPTQEPAAASSNDLNGSFQQRVARTTAEPFYRPGFVVTSSKAAGGAPSQCTHDIQASWVSAKSEPGSVKSDPGQ